MTHATVQKRPLSLTIISLLSLVVILLTITLYVRIYNRNPHASLFERQWYIIMILIQLPILAGVVLMYSLKRMGLWLFLTGKALFFALPILAGADVLGLMTPVFFIETATFSILFGKRIHYMK